MKRTALARNAPLKRSASKPRRGGISPASPAQRAKAKGEFCVVSGEIGANDPAHLAARSHGGCDSELCVVPLRRDIHRLFDDGKFDLLLYLVPHRTAEIQHALGHYNGDLIALLQRLTSVRWSPEAEA